MCVGSLPAEQRGPEEGGGGGEGTLTHLNTQTQTGTGRERVGWARLKVTLKHAIFVFVILKIRHAQKPCTQSLMRINLLQENKKSKQY